MKPVIGISPCYDDDRESIWMLPGYIEAVEKQGGIPIVLPFGASREDLLELDVLLSGYILTGGPDINPEIYGSEVSLKCGRFNDIRDRMDRNIIDIAYEKKKPLLAICRGHQLLNAVKGGTLYQDIPTEKPDAISHSMEKPYDQAWHTVQIIKNTPLYSLLGKEEIGVNSRHHQGVKILARDLVPMAIAPDGMVEAFYDPKERFLWGLQWHPEHALKDMDMSIKIMKKFIEECKQ